MNSPGAKGMKAIVRDEYGAPDVLRFEQVDIPEVSRDGVLVEVAAASLNPFDWHHMRGIPGLMRMMTGFGRPKNRGLGADFAGTVRAVGEDVTDLQPGDEVFGESFGSLAEFVTARAKNVARKPANISFEEAAGAPMTALTALQGIRDHGHVQAGQSVVVNGASGGVGSMAVQIAKSFGAEVTGVCSTRNVDLVKEIGADRVIDYTREDFTQTGEPFDVLFEAVGRPSLAKAGRSLRSGGVFVMVGARRGRWVAGLDRAFAGRLLFTFSSRRLATFTAAVNREDLETIAGMLERGTIKTVIDRTYSLGETAEAMRYLEEGHARGKVIITI